MTEITMDIQLAEQQLLGFFHAASGYSLERLVEAMDLTIDEFELMVENEMVDYLSLEEENEIRQILQSA